jgi:hypothetical protein
VWREEGDFSICLEAWAGAAQTGILQVTIFNTLQNNLGTIDFSVAPRHDDNR